jgi:hypothetical protein
MVRGNSPGNQDLLWCNLANRFHNGQPIKGNCRLDWWYYDPNTGNTIKDYISFYYYNTEVFPATSDWPASLDPSQGIFWYPNWATEQSVSLGASGDFTAGQPSGLYDSSKYQIRLEETRGASYGSDGWCNTSVMRSAAWHHYRILLGPPHADGTVVVYFYIDDLNTPAYAGVSTLATTGFGVMEIVSAWGNDLGYFDDISFALSQPPNLTIAPSGSSVTLTWPGEGWTLQSASTPGGTWNDIAGATSGYSYNLSSGVEQFFRLRN